MSTTFVPDCRLLCFGLYFPILFPFFVLNSLTKDLSAASEELEKSKQIIKELEEEQQSVKKFSSIEHFTFTKDCELARWVQGPVVQRVDDVIHWINFYPADSAVLSLNTYPLDSDLCGG